MVEVACPACGATDAVWLQRATDRFMGGPGEFQYARCAVCGLAYLGRRPPESALDLYYPRGYIRDGRGFEGLRLALRRHDLAPYVRLAARQPGRRLLDVGCARGDFLEEMRRRGWIVAGVEPTGWLAERALAKGLPVWQAPVSDAPLPPGAFDVATLWDVLEHLPRPVDDLMRIGRSLRPGGRLIVNTPVLDGWDARLFGASWSGWDAPRHLQVFSRRTLAGMLARAGFDVVSWHRVFETYLITALSISLAVRRVAPALARPVWSAVHARPSRLVAAPLFAVADGLLGASSVAVVAAWRGP